jgi:sugar phosphate permease
MLSARTLSARTMPTALADTEQASSTYRKVSRRLIPFLCLCYVISYLDRINIGFAKLQMAQDIQLSEAAYGLGAGLFFVGYILFEVPSNAALQKIGAKFWIARIMITWGILSGLTSLVSAPWQFYVLRILLGTAEAGFLPGVLFYLTTWFPSWRRARIISLLMIGVPLSSVIGGPLSGWIMANLQNTAGLRNWQWLFLLEAAPAVILGVLTFFVLPNAPRDAAWLAEDEKREIARALAADEEDAGHNKHRFLDGITDIKIWMLGGIDFSILLCTYAIGFWMPTFIRNAGVHDAFSIGLLTTIPSIATLFGMILIGASSDRMRERRWHIVLPFLVGGAALAASTFFTDNVTATVGLFAISSSMIAGTVPVFFSLPATFLRAAAAASGFALACSVANIAGLTSNSLIGLALHWTGSSSAAIWLFVTCLLVSALLVLALPSKLVNR